MEIKLTLQSGHLKLAIEGQLTYSDTAKYAEVLTQIKAAKAETCELTLDKLEHIDSSGIRMILLTFDLCKSNSSSLTISGARGQVRELLLHTRFNTILTLNG